jgi:hypothetical protein
MFLAQVEIACAIGALPFEVKRFSKSGLEGSEFENWTDKRIYALNQAHSKAAVMRLTPME